MHGFRQYRPGGNEAFLESTRNIATARVPGVVGIHQRVKESGVRQDHRAARTRAVRRPRALAEIASVNSSFARTDTSLRPLPRFSLKANKCFSRGVRLAC